MQTDTHTYIHTYITCVQTDRTHICFIHYIALLYVTLKYYIHYVTLRTHMHYIHSCIAYVHTYITYNTSIHTSMRTYVRYMHTYIHT